MHRKRVTGGTSAVSPRRAPENLPTPRRKETSGGTDSARRETRRGDRPRAGRTEGDQQGVRTSRGGRPAEAAARPHVAGGSRDRGARREDRRGARRQEDRDRGEGPRDQVGGHRDDEDLPRRRRRRARRPRVPDHGRGGRAGPRRDRRRHGGEGRRSGG